MSGAEGVISEGELRSVVRAASHAPSSHNTQPWLFEFRGDSIALFADRLRALPANDPFDRELTLSCGAALFNLRAALAAIGVDAALELIPEGHRSDLLAIVNLGRGGASDLAPFAEQIEHRRTTRGRLLDSRPELPLLERMAEAARLEGAWLELFDDGDRRDELCGLIAEGDRRQFADPTWRRELASWLHPRRSGDGLAMPGYSRPIAKLVVSALDLGRSTGRKDAELASDAPCLAVLGTTLDLDEDWIRAGQALQRALLLAAAEGFQAGYLNQPCQVVELRPQLGSLLRQRGHPQVVMRLGRPVADDGDAPRRPVDQIIRTA